MSAVAGSTMHVDVLEDWAAIAALEPEWNSLLRETNADNIFLTWEWVRCWADVMGPSVRALVVSVRDARGVLVGLAPLYQATLRLGSAVPYRVLRVMADFPTGADYPDWILRHDSDDAIASAIVQALAARQGWDFVWMAGMAGWAGSFHRIVAACRAAGLHCQIRPSSFSFFELPSEREAYFRALSTSRRKHLRADMKRVMARPAIEICRCDTETQLPAFLEALFDLHNRRWSEKGKTGSFRARPRQVAFYRRFAPIALRSGWLRLYGLRDAGGFKAVQFGYVYRNVFHQLQEGFDPEYVMGAGNVLRAKVIEACIEEGIEAYDFLGGMTDHKRRWMGRERTGYDVMIGRTTLKNRLLFKAGVWPSGRFMRQVLPPLHDQVAAYQPEHSVAGCTRLAMSRRTEPGS